MPLSIRIFVFAALCGFALGNPGAQETVEAQFDESTRQIAEMRVKLFAGSFDVEQLIEIRNEAGKLAGQADAVIADRVPALEAVDAQLADLGAVPAADSAPEAADITAQRAALNKRRSELDADIKRAKFVVSDGQQLAGQVAEARRDLFQEQISQRTPSPLLPTFWAEALDGSGRDISRLVALRDSFRTSMQAAFSVDNRTPSLSGLLGGLILIVFVPVWALRLWLRVSADRMVQGRLRRSALAFATLLIATVLPGLAAQAVTLGLNWNGAFVEPFGALASVLVDAIYLGGLIFGVGYALLASGRPSWRLAPISDAVAERLRFFPLLLAITGVLGFTLNRMNRVIGTSLSATIAVNFIVTLLYCAVLALILMRIRSTRLRKPTNHGDDGEDTPRASWKKLALSLLALGLLVAPFAAAAGYVAFAGFLAWQMIWIPVVIGVSYLLVCVVEDSLAAALTESGRSTWGRMGVRSSTLDQLAVLLSGLFRVVVFASACSILVAPIGASPDELFQRMTRFGAGLTIGQITITPSAILGALVVLMVGMLVMRLLKRWLSDHYLPTTLLEPGMRISITTLLGYAGGIIVFALALSALGLSVERIAWVASALSVGIGFGLQAIVQNFVSGLILLVERPVKVGDWVAIGDLEGDIRRINVRATEIEMGDRSTVIVPNSELITKIVRNVTLSNAEGRVRIHLPLPSHSDARRVSEIIREVLTAQTTILPKPAATVLLDHIDGTTLNFLVNAYVTNPRDSARIRSELIIEILERLRADGIAFAFPAESNPINQNVEPVTAPVSEMDAPFRQA